VRGNQRHSLLFVAITVLLDSVGFGVIIPVMPSLLVHLSGRVIHPAVLWEGRLKFLFRFRIPYSDRRSPDTWEAQRATPLWTWGVERMRVADVGYSFTWSSRETTWAV
jgi:hypothetical protein